VKVWEVFVVPNFQSSEAALLFILESFIMNIDVLFMIAYPNLLGTKGYVVVVVFLSQSACHFHFSYFKLPFTLFVIMSAALCYAIMLFIFFTLL
jgi:hypothetical protein